MKIIQITSNDTKYFDRMAELLIEGFRDAGTPSWRDRESAMQEVQEDLQDDRICFLAADDRDDVLGWIGGIRGYDGHAWELHPLVVKPGFQGQGIGRHLVAALEEAVSKLGGSTIYLGTDDENFRTTVSGIDLYPNVLEKLQNIENPGGHPYEFYRKVGFVIVGILPDANGPSKPDIFMAKRVKSGKDTTSLT